MEMWDWLRPWWNWWASLTDLFDWDAIAALATAAAVIVALEQSSRSSRISARHGAGVLSTLINLLEPIVEASEIRTSGDINEWAARHVLEEGGLARAAEAIARLPPGDTAMLAINDYLIGLPRALRDLQDDLPAVAEGFARASRLTDGNLWYLVRALEDFRERRDILLGGRVQRWARRVSAEIQRRWFFRRF